MMGGSPIRIRGGRLRRSAGLYCSGLISGGFLLSLLDFLCPTPPLPALKTAFLVVGAPLLALLAVPSEPEGPPEPDPVGRHELRWTLYLAFYLALGYFGIVHLTTLRDPVSHAIGWDQALPFLPQFTPIYVTVYPLYLLPFLLIRDRDFFHRALRGYAGLSTVAYALFLLLPATVARPPCPSPEFGPWVLRIVRTLDPPYNCFPSLHVSLALLASLTIRRLSRGWGNLAMVAAGIIALSTLLIRQHVLLDVLSGAILAGATYRWMLSGSAR